MTITFPRDMPAALADMLVSLPFRLEPVIEVTPLLSGARIALDRGPSVWLADMQTGPLPEEEMGIVRAFFDTLSSTGAFFCYDRLREYPLAYRKTGFAAFGGFDGTCILDAVAANKVELDLAGLPEDFVLSIGDYLAWDYGTTDAFRALHRIAAGATADGSGEATVEVRSVVRPGWESADSSGRVVTVYRAAARMLIVPRSYSEQIEANGFGRISAQAVQTL